MILQKIIQFVKEHLDDIILIVGVILISLLSFAAGYIVARQQEKEPLKIEYENSNNWSWNKRALSCLETFGEGT